MIDFLPPPKSLEILTGRLFPGSGARALLLPLHLITGDLLALTRHWLHKREWQQLTIFASPKRRKEWLGGRICAKQGIRLFLERHYPDAPIPQHQQHKVVSDRAGRPSFSRGHATFEIPQLSISHSGDFACALISRGPCGIDVQHPSETLARVRERFVIPAEEGLMGAKLPLLSPRAHLTLLWSAKEALKKMLSPTGLPGFHDLRLREVEAFTGQTATLFFRLAGGHNKTLSVATALLSNHYALAFCCDPNLHPSTNNHA